MGLKGARVLLVEDTGELRDVFTTLLETEGAVVTATSTGRGALECLAQGTFEIVLTDLGLPDIPGESVIREIMATSQPRPRVVAVTGYGEFHVARARAAGADAVLTKPVEWSVLRQDLEPTEATAA